MCGIVGILGEHEVSPILVEALRRMEYRGYDSAGIATIQDRRLDRRRAVGKLVNLSDLLVHDPLPGKAGIGHTRWATHGAPTVANAHPHRAGRVAVVHNGIIENFRDLRAELTDDGVAHESDTDTETVAILTERFMDAGMDPVEAAHATIARLDGAYALAFLFDGEEDLIVAARKGSPLAIGRGDGEMYVGSDALALAPMTSRITYLEEGDTAVVTRAGATIRDADGALVSREERVVALEDGAVDKSGHRHFMAKEIAEQPDVLTRVLDHYLDGDGLRLPEVLTLAETRRVSLVACGTAYYACAVAKYWIESMAGVPCDLDVASEYRYREPPVPDATLALFVSQSGETADTLAALRYVRGRAAQVASVVNVVESSIGRDSDVVLPIHAGPEIGVASTKAFTAQLTVLAVLALGLAHAQGRLDDGQLASRVAELRRLPGLVNAAMGIEPATRELSGELAEARDILFLGRGPMFPLAMEGALKLKEISYIHAEGYASGELKHGPIALIDQHVPVIVFAPTDPLFDKTVSNMQEVMARGGRVLLVTDAQGRRTGAHGVWDVVEMPTVDPFLAPILYALPAQMLAYHTAVAKGTDVDQPRNLAKSVTVE
ncbi:MAG: glutamine--fructose-6-phosphate transaminase (isomerizing) [Paracoccaceae bacterium]